MQWSWIKFLDQKSGLYKYYPTFFLILKKVFEHFWNKWHTLYKGGLMPSFLKHGFIKIYAKTLIETYTNLEGGQRVKGQK